MSETPLYILDLTNLGKALRSLTPKERRITLLRFGLLDGRTHTLEETGKKFQVTRERIRQIETRSFDKLRIAYSTLFGAEKAGADIGFRISRPLKGRESNLIKKDL